MNRIDREKTTVKQMIEIYCHGKKHVNEGLCEDCSNSNKKIIKNTSLVYPHIKYTSTKLNLYQYIMIFKRRGYLFPIHQI